ncbi:MAG: choice-of-anchor A family protein, partial [Ruminococcus sp.]|nr:choice-of-anchor A family protein [Ruminococcus sp.]
LIDFTDAFSHIRGQADKLKVIKTTNGGSTVWNDSELTCTVPESCQDKTVYFTLDEWHDPTKINFVNIPTYVDNDGKEKLANIIVNCGGENIEIGRVTNGIEININETTISKEGTGKNNHKYSENILWNFYEATELYIDANFNGTILSPNADAESEDGCNGHLSGSLIAKSFEGGLEFGYRPYRGTVDILGSSNGYAIPFDKFIKGTDKERLAGATFGVYDGENLLTTFTSGQDTEFVNLPSKVDFEKSEENAEFTTTYTIKEISAPDGFVLDDITEYTVTITEKVLNGIFDDSGESSGSGAILTGRPSEVEAVVSISSNKAEYKEQKFSIHLKDIWGYDVSSGSDKIIRRELVVDNETFYLNLDNGKIVSVMKKEGEPLSTGTAVVTRASLVSAETSTEYDTDIPVTTELTDAEGNA